MTNYVTDHTVDNVIVALADFLQPFAPDAQIVRAQANNVPMPIGPCIYLTELFTIDIETSTVFYDSVADTSSIKAPKKIDIQIDYYGPLASEYCAAVQAVFRTPYAFEAFPSWIKPLYLDDGRQNPFISAEQNWVSRWTTTAHLQYNPSVIVPQQFADTVTVTRLPPADISGA